MTRARDSADSFPPVQPDGFGLAGDLPAQTIPLSWRFLGVFLLMAAVIIAVGRWAYVNEADYLREKENQALRAIADFKAYQIQDWLAERRLDGMALVGTPYFRGDVKRWLVSGDAAIGGRLRARLESLGINDNYASVELLDRRGISRLSVAPAGYREEPLPPALLTETERSTEPRFIDLFRHGEHIYFCYLIPIGDDMAGGTQGYLRQCIDPRRHLFALVESWPTPSRTAETLLVRQEGDDVLFLNEVRHRKDTALTFRLPLGREDLPSAVALRGRTGVFSGRDYRGVPVLSYLRPIDGTPWRMVTKIDQEEVFRNIARVSRISILGVGTAIAICALIFWLLWRRHQLLASLANARVLRRRSEELEAFMAAVPTPVFISNDKDCSCITGNRAANDLFGIPAGTNVSLSDSRVAETVYHVHDPDGRKLRPDELPMERAVLSGRAVENQECHIHFNGGRTLWLLGNAVPLFDELGMVRGCVASYADITRIKAHEQELRRSQAALVQAGQMARLGAWSVELVDSSELPRNSTVWSDETFRILGFEPGSVAPSTELFLSTVHPEDLSLVQGEWDAAIRDRRSIDCEYRIIRPDGGERIIHTRGEFDFDDTGKTIHCYGAIQDITERKQLELAREAHSAQLEEQVAARTAELMAANRELQAFTYAASHDLKAPLRGIHSFSTLLERNYRDRLEGDGLLFLDFIRTSAERMNHLIDDLLAHAQLDKLALDIQPVDLTTVAHAALTERKEEIRQRGTEVRIDLPAAHVWAESHGLIQVLRNLLENALKYSAQARPPVIEVGGENRGGCYRLWVRDNGIGFDMAYHDRIFEIFRRLHTYDEFPGSGVGLALVRKAMDRVGGKVWAESSPGKGAVFYLELPLCLQESNLVLL